MDHTSSITLPKTFDYITNLSMNHLDRKNRKIATKLRQQEKKETLAKESNETDENNSETETFSAVENPNITALQDSDTNIAREANNNIKRFGDDAVHDDDKNENFPGLRKLIMC